MSIDELIDLLQHKKNKFGGNGEVPVVVIHPCDIMEDRIHKLHGILAVSEGLDAVKRPIIIVVLEECLL